MDESPILSPDRLALAISPGHNEGFHASRSQEPITPLPPYIDPCPSPSYPESPYFACEERVGSPRAPTSPTTIGTSSFAGEIHVSISLYMLNQTFKTIVVDKIKHFEFFC